MRVEGNAPSLKLCCGNMVCVDDRCVSYGQMVGCDYEDCPIGWFHTDCVGLTHTPVGSPCHVMFLPQLTYYVLPVSSRRMSRGIAVRHVGMRIMRSFRGAVRAVYDYYNHLCP